MSESIGRYRLERRLATGGMAEVYLARQVGPDGFERLCVLKRMLPELTVDASLVQMFLDEAKLVALLSHPNIAQIFDFGRTGNAYFLAMEYVPGITLRALIQDFRQRHERLSEALACRIIADAALGLHFAHEARDLHGNALGIIHRDISPANILLSQSGAVKLIDFGVAKASSASQRTASGVVKGKFAYMSPEQIVGGPLDRRADLFALGLVLYELLTNTRAYEAENEAGVVRRAVERQLAPAQTLRADLSDGLAQVLEKVLSAQPSGRHGDAAEFAAALEAHLMSQGQQVPASALAALAQAVRAREVAVEARTPSMPLAYPPADFDLPLGQVLEDSQAAGPAAREPTAATRSLDPRLVRGLTPAPADAAAASGTRLSPAGGPQGRGAAALGEVREAGANGAAAASGGARAPGADGAAGAWSEAREPGANGAAAVSGVVRAASATNGAPGLSGARSPEASASNAASAALGGPLGQAPWGPNAALASAREAGAPNPAVASAAAGAARDLPPTTGVAMDGALQAAMASAAKAPRAPTTGEGKRAASSRIPRWPLVLAALGLAVVGLRWAASATVAASPGAAAQASPPPPVVAAAPSQRAVLPSAGPGPVGAEVAAAGSPVLPPGPSRDAPVAAAASPLVAAAGSPVLPPGPSRDAPVAAAASPVIPPGPSPDAPAPVAPTRQVPPRAAKDARVKGAAAAARAPKPVELAAALPVAAATPARRTALQLEASPPARVSIGGQPRGTTPLTLELPPGPYEVEFVNEALRRSERRKISLAEGETRREEWKLGAGTVSFRVLPYGEVFEGGKSLGVTPLPPQERLEGLHTFRIVHPDSQRSETREIEVLAGKTVQVKVDLSGGTP